MGAKCKTALFASVLLVCWYLPGSAATVHQQGNERVREYRRHTFGRSAWIGHGAKAGFSQAAGHPHGWGGGLSGFGKRFGSSAGTGILNNTIALGVGAVRHEDFHYYKSHKQGTWPRLRYAVASTFITRRKNRPGRTIAAGRLSGAFGSGLISQAWQPAAVQSVGAGLSTGGIALGATVAANVTREFLPEHKHKAARTQPKRVRQRG